MTKENRGWHREPYRHSLASRGIGSKKRPQTFQTELCSYIHPTPISEKQPIEPHVKPVIDRLNEMGVETQYSCEGHLRGEVGSAGIVSPIKMRPYVVYRSDPDVNEIFEDSGFELVDTHYHRDGSINPYHREGDISASYWHAKSKEEMNEKWEEVLGKLNQLDR